MLRPIQGLFSSEDYPDLLVGIGQPDDASVWRLDDERALVVTTDFFTPVVDNPYDYGAIAAANALSDVYAMGGAPFLALNIAALPPDLPAEISAEIFRGGAEKALEAGVVIAGGHTVQDKEPKYGLVVLGFVRPERLISKSGARTGDILVLTKPLGFGTVTTALKSNLADPEDVDEAVRWMKRLNKTAAQIAVACGVRGGTDVTGFSLIGHAIEIAEASGLGLRFDYTKIPFTSGAKKYAADWVFPGGSFDNQAFYGKQVRFKTELDEPSRILLYDPQTSGGLLLAVPPEKIDDFLSQAVTQDQPAWVIGEAIAGQGIEIRS